MKKSICLHVGNNIAAARNHNKLAMELTKRGFEVTLACDGDISYNKIDNKNFNSINFARYINNNISNDKKVEAVNFLNRYGFYDLKEFYYTTLKFSHDNRKYEKTLVDETFKRILVVKNYIESGFTANLFLDFAGNELHHNIFKILSKASGGKLIFYRGSLFYSRLGFSTNRFGVWQIPEIKNIIPNKEEKDFILKYKKEYFENKKVFGGSPESRDVKLKLPKLQKISRITNLRSWIRFQKNIKHYVNKKVNYFLYDKIEDIENKEFYYFPIHHPLDSQLTYRGKPFVNQIDFIRSIYEFLPYNKFLVVKEHPHAIGAIGLRELNKIRKLPNIILLHPWVNSHDILIKSKAVLIINSTVGLEAYYHNIPVISFGINYLTGHNICNEVKSFYDMFDMFNNLKMDNSNFDLFLLNAYRETYDFLSADFIRKEVSDKQLSNFAYAIDDFISSKFKTN